ncbi:hypothetical protein DL89DRAFT_182247 [Linderina pennispora]|uniref:Uncharacterized protein n=1 Tax=Linderina pennispora TaxID=61395 RepID=A0A1Y1W568_9FUNG|nr:uncharacterized protein DL89DRAFT_182247 [Linderina pennispora]ORX68693.1 hypothetical protein DL89DRAFT_182247 [Linderina pennispora]
MDSVKSVMPRQPRLCHDMATVLLAAVRNKQTSLSTRTMPRYSETADPRLCIHGCMSLSHFLQGLSRDAATQTLFRSSFSSSSFLLLKMSTPNSEFDTIMS